MRALALALLLAACAAPDARMREAAEVMAPLIGCWRGTFDNDPNIVDERCFAVLDGRHVVDTHAVRPTEYSGETTYHLDETSGRIVFAYASSAGGRSNGELTPIENGFAFPAHAFRGADGAALRLRSTWRFDSADSFRVLTEREEGRNLGPVHAHPLSPRNAGVNRAPARRIDQGRRDRSRRFRTAGLKSL